LKKAKLNDQKKIAPLQVNVRLVGKDAERFLRYKEREKLLSDAQASYKLMIERLDQIEAAA
jgi:hypothetical protein